MSTPAILRRFSAILHSRVLWYSILALPGLVLLYAILGFFALPRIIESQAAQFAQSKLHRTLHIDKVEINPFTLRATVTGLKLMEPRGSAVFFSFDSLLIKLSSQSITHLVPVVEEVRLNKPYLKLLREDRHHYNVDDILAIFSSPPASTQPEQPARFSIYNIQLEDGRIEFVDKSEKSTQVVSELKIGVPFVSSLPSQVEIFVEPLIRAKINGEPFEFSGKTRPFAEPKEATLHLALDNIDVPRYLEYLPFEPHFKLPSAHLDIHLDANFQQAKNRKPSLELSGTVTLKSLQLADSNSKPVLTVPKLELTLGKSKVLEQKILISRVLLNDVNLDLAREDGGKLNLQRLLDTTTLRDKAVPKKNTDGQSALQLQVDDVEIRNAAVHYRDDFSAPTIHADSEKINVAIHHTAVDTTKHSVKIDEVESNQAAFLLDLGNPVSAPQKKNSDDGSTYIVNLDRLAISNWSSRINDQRLPQPVTTTIGALGLHLKNLSTSAAALSEFDLSTAVNGSGQLALQGKFSLNPLHVDLALDMQSIDLLGFQPYLTDRVNLVLSSGNVSSKGTVTLDQNKDLAWTGGFKGDVTLGKVATVDKVSGDDFLRWKSLFFGSIDLQLAPLAVTIDQIALSDFFARVIIAPNGQINLQNIVRNNANSGKSLTASSDHGADKTPPAPAVPVAQPKMPIKIGKLTLQGGDVRYTDNFIKPHYSADLVNVGGLMSGLSSDVNSRATVDLHGQVNEAPLTITGTINPLKDDLSLDIKANVRGMELVPLSPYSGRYVGYNIEKGQLSFDVAYQIEHRKLQAQNRLILDQLTFGDKVDSPMATKLPVQLAVALLRNRDGVIDVDMPIGGSLDDPDFSVGGIVTKLIVSMIAKTVTAPFALLGKLFGGEELSTVAFDAGQDAITPATQSKLGSLAKAMTERPALKLDITGWTDADIDRPALQHIVLEQKVEAIKLKDQTAHGSTAAKDKIAISPEEYPVLLARAYRAENFPKPRNTIGLVKDLPVPEMEKLMLANTVIGDDDLQALGDRRASIVKDWLFTNGHVAEERLFVKASKSGTGTSDNDKKAPARVDFDLH